MKRSIHRGLRAPLPALARGLALCVMILALLAPSAAWAGIPYSIHWVSLGDSGSCISSGLGKHNGEAFFHVNDTPLPTYQIPGALMTNADGSESNVIEAGFDSVLLRVGANDFAFSVRSDSGDDSCVHSHEVVNLISVPLGINKPLFDVRRDGTAFAGVSTVDLALAEINPPLAQDIVNLEALIAKERERIFANAAKLNDLALTLDILKQLDADLHDLVERPLDEIDPDELDAIFDKYGGGVINAATRAALAQLIQDLKKSIDDLHEELASLIDNFGEQAGAAADLATQEARAAGFNPDDPLGYTLGSSDVPPVAIPDLSGVPGAFSDGNDPYDAYADAVIDALAEDVSGGQVIERADFVAQVRAWRANQAALSKALLMNGASVAETNAFLKAQNKVTAYVHKFLDGQDWFKDSDVPPDVRTYVDVVFKPKFDKLADQLKDALNGLPPVGDIDLTKTQLFQVIRGFGGAMSAIETVATPYFEMMATIVQTTARVGVGFVPYVGPMLDFCEAVTGRAWCLPDGEELSDEQRIFAGAGVAVSGVAKFWGGVTGAGVGVKAAEVAGDIAKVDEAIAMGLHANPRTWYKTLKGACQSGALEDFEKVAGRYMQEEGRALIGIGDDGVRDVLKIPADAANDAAKAPDFLSVTKGNKLALSEVKSGTLGNAVKQLENGVKAVQSKGLLGDLERVEIVVKKGQKLGDNNLMIKNGFLFNIAENKPVEIQGFKNLFVRVIEL